MNHGYSNGLRSWFGPCDGLLSDAKMFPNLWVLRFRAEVNASTLRPTDCKQRSVVDSDHV